MLIERIKAHILEARGDFEALALEAFAFQFERLGAYRALCERRGASPATVRSWQQVPMVPTLAFKSLELAIGEPRETFRSSGTTSASRSVHRHVHPDLYRATIDAAFPSAALPSSFAATGVPMLSLIPSREQLPDSSLSFMIDHVMQRWGSESSRYAISDSGVDARSMRAWLAAVQRGGTPGLILATPLALVDALDKLGRLGLRFRLPAGSLLFETGGYKGLVRQVAPRDLERRVEAALGIAADHVVREYGMTELTSQLYSSTLAGGANDRFATPHWVRVQVLDPLTLEVAPSGAPGVIAVFDLGNIGSAIHLLTEDLGALSADGLRLHGRAQGAELRGCSLAAEELAAS